MRRTTALLLGFFALLVPVCFAQDAKPAPDVLLFTNGDQLTGKLLRAVGGNVVFKSDVAGELTISFDKIKQLRSGEQFALLRKGAPVNATDVQVGSVQVEAGTLSVLGTGTAALASPGTSVPVKEVAFLIDRATFQKNLAHRAGPFEGWSGTVAAGATVVRSTQNGTTFSTAVNLVRAIPTVPYLPARNRTLVNFAESYGKLTTPATSVTTASVVKTSIFHADAERDEYLSPRFFVLAGISYDHNFSQALDLQQVYGAGFGWTPLQNARQQLDFKGDVHYEKQAFQNDVGDQNLFGSTFAEAYRRNLPRKLLFTETANYLPAWNHLQAYSANATATLAMPVFKRLSASVSSTDNYLNNPPFGFDRNSFQFITGVTYSLR